MAELFFNVIVALIALVALIGGTQIPITDQPLARYWPLTVSTVLLVMLSIKIIRLWKDLPEEEKAKAKDFSFLKLKDRKIRFLALAIVASILYVVMLVYFGYVIATIVYGFALAFLLGGRCWWKNLIASIIITCILYAVFTWGLGIHPARGVGIFAKFSKWLEYLF